MLNPESMDELREATEPSATTLLDVVGEDVEALYSAGQILTVLEGLQLRQPGLRILLVGQGQVTPTVMALDAGRLYSMPTTAPLRTDLNHQNLLRQLCGKALAAEPLDLTRLLYRGDVYELRPSSLVGIRQATWEVAATADALVGLQTPRTGLAGLLDATPLALLRRRQQIQDAENAWTSALTALIRMAGQTPVRELRPGQEARRSAPAAPDQTTASWDVA